MVDVHHDRIYLTKQETNIMYQEMMISGLKVHVLKKNIKNLHLSVQPPDGWVRVAAPLSVTDDVIRLFIIDKLSWIKKHQTNFNNQARQSRREYVSGESHYYQGQRYLLNVIYCEGSTRIGIRNKKYIDLYIKSGSDEDKRKRAIAGWYRQHLKQVIPQMIAKWEPIMGVKVDDWGVKQMKTKWGTCNPQAKRIWLNLELAKKVPHCLEYVVIHEMCHLLVPNHGKKFQALMTKFMPNWRLYENELNHSHLSEY